MDEKNKIGKNVPPIDFNLKMGIPPSLSQPDQPQSYVQPPPVAITQPRKDGSAWSTKTVRGWLWSGKGSDLVYKTRA